MTDRLFTILSTGSAAYDGTPPWEKETAPDHIRVEEIPFIRIDLVADEIIRNQLLALAMQKLSVIFTSANAVRAVTALLPQKPDWRIYCIGNTTQKQVVSFFGETAIAGTAANADELSGVILNAREKQAVFFCGNQRRQTLPDVLKEKGLLLQELVVYHTHCTPVRIDEDFDAILFFSPTAATSFFSMNTVPPRTVLFALGRTTGEALRRYAENELVLADSPDKASLFQMAIAYGQSHPIH